VNPVLRFAVASCGVAGAVCVVVATRTTYAFAGFDGHATTLLDSAATLAYNVVFVAALLTGGLLTCFKVTASLGMGMSFASGLVFPALSIGDIVTMIRSTPSGTSTYYAPGAGFYWGISGSALAIAGAIAATAALRRSGALRLHPNTASVWWAILGLVLSATFIVGTWLPWKRETLTGTVNGASKTIQYDPCCSLSHEPGQWATQWIIVTACIAAVCLLAACISSAATATGIILAAAVYSAAQNIDALFDQPYTLAQLAPGLGVTESQLQLDKAVVTLHRLPGAWITAAAALGLILLAAARYIHGAAGETRQLTTTLNYDAFAGV
jgi:hypothetical protein